jgi:hypothetical protein
MLQLTELDQTTRRYMLSAFEDEEASGNPYRSQSLSTAGRQAFPDLMREAIRSANEGSLDHALLNHDYWLQSDRRGRLNMQDAARRLAVGEFNTWYVRGLALRLLDEGEEYCEVYRAAPAYQPRPACSQYEGRPIPWQAILDAHRAKYHPVPNPNAFSIPAGPHCHHSIRRLSSVQHHPTTAP